jgi:hypothetical protein
MGTIGDKYDNAVIESFWARMQTEPLDRRRWKTRVELANAIFEYLEIFHNRQRRHSALGWRSPLSTRSSAQPTLPDSHTPRSPGGAPDQDAPVSHDQVKQRGPGPVDQQPGGPVRGIHPRDPSVTGGPSGAAATVSGAQGGQGPATCPHRHRGHHLADLPGMGAAHPGRGDTPEGGSPASPTKPGSASTLPPSLRQQVARPAGDGGHYGWKTTVRRP